MDRFYAPIVSNSKWLTIVGVICFIIRCISNMRLNNDVNIIGYIL